MSSPASPARSSTSSGSTRPLSWLSRCSRSVLGSRANILLFFVLFRCWPSRALPDRALLAGALLGAVGVRDPQAALERPAGARPSSPAFQAFGDRADPAGLDQLLLADRHVRRGLGVHVPATVRARVVESQSYPGAAPAPGGPDRLTNGQPGGVGSGAAGAAVACSCRCGRRTGGRAGAAPAASGCLRQDGGDPARDAVLFLAIAARNVFS